MKDQVFFHCLYVLDFGHAGVFVCVYVAACVCWTCRGKGDVMFSLCLANPVVSTPNSRVYGV